MHRRYCVLPSEDLNDEDTLYQYRKIIHKVLNDHRGWRKYGVIFEDVTDNYKYDPKVIEVRFYDNENMKKFGLKGLSAYDIGANNIYFNIQNWNKGGKDQFTKTEEHKPIDRYRIYVINHEFGHSLGLDHIRPKNRDGMRGSIMMQMTKGNKHIHPCTLNEWPLDKEDFDELNQGRTYKTIFDGGNPNRGISYLSFIILAIFVIFTLIFTILIRCTKSNYIENGNNQRFYPKRIRS